MPCSVFENDETVKGRKAGSSVEYCDPCFQEVMEEDEKVECNDSNESGKNRDLQKQEPITAPDRGKKNGPQRGNHCYGAKIWYRTQAFLFLPT